MTRWTGPLSGRRLARRVGAALSVIVIVVPGPDTSGEAPTAPPTDSQAQTRPLEQAPSEEPRTGDSGEPGQSEASSTGGGMEPVRLVAGTGETVQVSDAASLSAALAAAKPGQTIEMADGTYSGKFEITTAGEEGNPITLRGSRNAVINGGGTGTGYDLHLVGASHWQLVGFSVTGLEKGVMADKTSGTVLSSLDIGNTGAEAVHFLNFSSDNTIQNSVIHDTGKTKPQFGEGVYFGTAKSNWGRYSGGQPDKSNNNRAIRNTFKSITAENIDAKEETTGGVIAGNMFDGSATSGKNFADSILDIKGENYQVAGNTTTGSSPNLKNGFETHKISGATVSGCNNVFQDNRFEGVTFAAGGTEIAPDPKCGGSKGGSTGEATSATTKPKPKKSKSGDKKSSDSDEGGDND